MPFFATEAFWKQRVGQNRLSNLGKQLAKGQTKQSRRNKRINEHNKRKIEEHKNLAEAAEFRAQQAEQEAERLRGKLYEATSIFDRINTLASTYPDGWVASVRNLAGRGVSVTSGS